MNGKESEGSSTDQVGRQTHPYSRRNVLTGFFVFPVARCGLWNTETCEVGTRKIEISTLYHSLLHVRRMCCQRQRSHRDKSSFIKKSYSLKMCIQLGILYPGPGCVCHSLWYWKNASDGQEDVSCCTYEGFQRRS